MSTLFRVDGSHKIGTGHVMRCIALAEALEKVGKKSIFVTRNYEHKIIELIRLYGFNAKIIPKDSLLKEDATLTLKIAKEYNVNLIVTDLCHSIHQKDLESYDRYLQVLNGSHIFLVVIDGTCKIKYSCDILVDPYYGTENRHYESFGKTIFLLGTKYFIFRKEFIEAAKSSREIKKDARNILITMGGSDLYNITSKVVKALKWLNIPNLNIRIVIGPCYAKLVEQKLERILRDYKRNYELIVGSKNIAELMLWSDLAIISGGLSKYETAVTGTPNIIISQFACEAKINEGFEKAGTTLNLGLATDINEKDIQAAIKKLLDDHTLRIEMSKRCKDLVDGQGVSKIISKIPWSELS